MTSFKPKTSGTPRAKAKKTKGSEESSSRNVKDSKMDAPKGKSGKKHISPAKISTDSKLEQLCQKWS